MRRRRNKGRTENTTVMEAVEKFREFLHEKSLRVTDVREAIVKAVMARRGHFHIDDLVRDLRRQRFPLSRIAYEAGFADQAHFTRAFKSAAG